MAVERAVPSGCALATIVSPKPGGIRNVLQVQSDLSHRAGIMGAGFAVDYLTQEVLARKACQHGLTPDGDRNHFSATVWNYSSDIEPDQIRVKLGEKGVNVWLMEDVPTDPAALNSGGLSTRPFGIHRIFATVDDLKTGRGSKLERREKEYDHFGSTIVDLQRECFPQGQVLFPSFTRVTRSGEDGFGGIEIFKGVGTVQEIANFYTELVSILAKLWMAHGRFPTLTGKWWGGAHPFQQGGWVGIHNGNIISYAVHFAVLKNHYALLAGTDSEAIPAMVDYLVKKKGLPVEVALLSLKVPAWLQRKGLTQAERDFITALNITFDDMLLDGPAGLILTDGKKVYALTGRHGVRPLYVTRDGESGSVSIASEVGPVSAGAVPVSQGKIDSNESVVVYVEGGKVKTETVKDRRVISQAVGDDGKGRRIYQVFDLSQNARDGSDREAVKAKKAAGNVHEALVRFGCSPGTLKRLRAEAQSGTVRIQSTGEKKPLAIFRGKNARFLSFFQIGASEVGDPPIDPDRTNIETVTHLGRRADSLDDIPEIPYKQLILKSPILFSTQYLPEEWSQLSSVLSEAAGTFGTAIIGRKDGGFAVPVDMRSIIITDFNGDFYESVGKICLAVEKEINSGKSIIVLSDIVEKEASDVIPATLVVGLVDKFLKDKGIRHQASLVVESLEVASSAAVFKTLALGANAVSIDPRLLLAALGIGEYNCCSDPISSEEISQRQAQAGVHNLFTSWTHQLKKLMGGADITDVSNLVGNTMLVQSLGLGTDMAGFFGVVDERIGRRNWDFFVRRGIVPFMDLKFAAPCPLAEHHSKEFARMLRKWIKGEISTAEFEAAAAKTDYFSLLKLKETEGVKNDPEKVSLRTRLFPTPGLEREIGLPVVMGGVSLGAGQIKLHEIFGRVAAEQNTFYNTGEGGRPLAMMEDLDLGKIKRFLSEDEWTTLQVASGRFGLSMEVLRHSGVLEIKIAQGAKPGIGGHLPGGKVRAIVSVARGVPEGSSVISPSTHQDITSIEDLRALISLLREATGGKIPIQVKLAVLPGMEWIAIGAVRCGADALVIDGFRGSTGAAPWAQQNEVGLPVASAIALIDDALRREGIRDQVSLIAGGGLRTAEEFLMAIAMGADAVMVVTPMMEAIGCLQCGICHTGKCPAGITAGMGPGFEKWESFLDVESGKKELNAWFEKIKEEMRIRLAKMSLSSADELRGRREYLSLIENRETVSVLDPRLTYKAGEDYSYLAAPLLKREWIEEAFLSAEKKLGRVLSGESPFSPVDVFDTVSAVDDLVRIAGTPGILPDQRQSVIEKLDLFAGHLSQVEEGENLVGRIGNIGGFLRSGKNDAIQGEMEKLYEINTLTRKLGANRVCGCMGECRHKRPKGGAVASLVVKLQEAMDKIGHGLDSVRKREMETSPSDGQEETGCDWWERKRELVGQSVEIDASEVPLTGEHFVAVALVRVLDEFREINPEWIGEVTLKVSGVAGHDLAALAPRGLTVELVEAKGRISGVQNGLGKMGQGGRIIIHGSTGDLTGYAMRAGRIYIKGRADDLVAANLRGVEGPSGPVIVIGAGVKNRACESMAGGTVIIIGDGLKNGEEIVGGNFAPGVFGGTVFVRAPADELEKHIEPRHLENLDLQREEAGDIQQLSRQMAEARNDHTRLLEQIISSGEKNEALGRLGTKLQSVLARIKELEAGIVFREELMAWCGHFNRSFEEISAGTWTRVTAKTRNPQASSYGKH